MSKEQKPTDNSKTVRIDKDLDTLVTNLFESSRGKALGLHSKKQTYDYIIRYFFEGIQHVKRPLKLDHFRNNDEIIIKDPLIGKIFLKIDEKKILRCMYCQGNDECIHKIFCLTNEKIFKYLEKQRVTVLGLRK